MFKLFGDVDTASELEGGGSPSDDGGGGFKLFGDVTPLALEGDSGEEGAEHDGGDDGGFKLFGDVTSLPLQGESGSEGEDRGAPRGEEAEPGTNGAAGTVGRASEQSVAPSFHAFDLNDPGLMEREGESGDPTQLGAGLFFVEGSR